MANDRDDVLRLLSGSARSFEVYLLDDHDAPEDLSGATEARLRIARDSSDAANTAILDRSTADSNLAINPGESKLVASYPVPADANLPLGRFIGQASVRISGAWYDCDPFHVEVLPQIAPHS